MNLSLDFLHHDEDLEVRQRPSALLPRLPRLRVRISSPVLLAGGLMVTAMLLLAAFAPVIAPFDAAAMNPTDRLQAPSSTHLFGTDNYGRDLFSRVLYGARLSLSVSLGSAIIGSVLGNLLGIIAGIRRGWLETILTQCMDAWLALPGLLVALVMAAAFGRSLLVLGIALGLASIPMFYRIARAETLRVSGLLYVHAAESLGASRVQIIRCHVLPNIAPSLIVLFTITTGRLLLAVSALSFIGLGAPPPAPEWGTLMADGRNYMHDAWWLTWFPGLMISLTTFGFFLLGDGLRDLLDPNLRHG